MATIHEIPVEILSHIFVVALDDEYAPNFYVADNLQGNEPFGVQRKDQVFHQVCRKWQEVFDSTPSAWVTTLVFPSNLKQNKDGIQRQVHESVVTDRLDERALQVLFNSRIEVGGVLSRSTCDVDL